MDWAIEIAQRVGLPLRIAAKIDQVDREYFDDAIRPLLSLPDVEYPGEINDAEKAFSRRGGQLFPIDGPEPRIVDDRGTANGTPVAAFRHGAVPEDR
jgi:hypothetical protein